jgi:hypothetical protein
MKPTESWLSHSLLPHSSFVCAIQKKDRSLALFRNYFSKESIDINPTIWEAGRATSAATTFFDPVKIGQDELEFVDGATGFNNPVQQVLNEARALWPDAMERIQSIISIGTGERSVTDFGDNALSIGKTLIKISTDTEATAEQFPRSHPEFAKGSQKEHIYQRFNVDKGLESVKLNEFDKTSDIIVATNRYLRHSQQRDRMVLFGSSVYKERIKVPENLGPQSDKVLVKIQGQSLEHDLSLLLPLDCTIRSLYEKNLQGKGELEYTTSYVNMSVYHTKALGYVLLAKKASSLSSQIGRAQ